MTGDWHAATFRSGEILDGRYRIGPQLGEGGMGVVFEAHHLGLDERVAIKFLNRSVMRTPDAVARVRARGASGSQDP